MKRTLQTASFAAALLCAAWAAGEPSRLYEVEARAEPRQVSEGGSGTITIAIKAQTGAHVSAEAPLKVTLAATNLKLEKERLTRGDAAKDAEEPRFEVPFTATGKGSGTVDGEVVFFICTDKLCERQAAKVSVPVAIK